MGLEIGRETKIGVSVVDIDEIDSLLELAKSTPRKRTMLTLHGTQSEIMHRTIIAILPESYLRPHRNTDPSQIETFSPLIGIAELITFSEDGKVGKRILLKRGMVVEVESDVWHTIVARTPFAMFELKSQSGGYEKGKDKIDAPWAPEEGSKEGEKYLESLRRELDLMEAS